MDDTQEPSNLEELLERIGSAGSKEEGDGNEEKKDLVSLGEIVQAVGSRSFGPLLLMAGVVITSPLSGIPGLPTCMAILVLLIAAQLLFRRDHFWLPRWLLNRKIAQSKVDKSVKWLRPSARFVDRLIRPRLAVFTRGASIYVIAIICIVISLGMPIMEVVPFSATAAGTALLILGLSLIACDGLLALIAFSIVTGALALVIHRIL